VERLLEFHLHKLERPESYRNLPEFIHLKQLLIKGIAYHHSGLIPVLKEMIEILFSRGLVKVLIATETFAVGINMPTKTVVFTALDKYDSSGNNRWLHTHEYLQMAGRAGRRGMDTIGYVIHLANLCDLPNMTELKTMMTGKSQTIKSRFTLNYQFILKAILNESVDLQQIVKTSFWNQELTQQINSLKVIKGENIEPIDLDEYKDCQRYETLMSNSIDLDGIIKLHPIIIKENKKAAQKMLTPGFKLKFNNYTKLKSKIETATELNNRIDSLERRLEDDLQKVLVFLQDYDYISKNWNKYHCFEITKNDILMKGIMASQVNQCQELLLTEIVHRNILHELSSSELAAYLSIFSNYSLPDNTDYNQNNPNDMNNMNERKITYSWYLMTAYKKTKSIADNLYDEEVKRNIYLPSDWDISEDLMEITFKWASEGVMLKDFPLGGIFAGEFIKEMIKVGHLADEVAILADLLQMTELKQKALEVSRLVIKDVINVDSLYLKNIH
jgi:superfamily II RNA helicase